MLSYETYAHVKDMIEAQAQEPIVMKGIGRAIVPYKVNRARTESAEEAAVIKEVDEGLSLMLDMSGLDSARAARLRQKLQDALTKLDQRLPVPNPSATP
jgi:hypothetical protein